MKALKVIDLIVVGLFMIGLIAGFTQTRKSESTSAELVAEVDPQYVNLIEPSKLNPVNLIEGD